MKYDILRRNLIRNLFIMAGIVALVLPIIIYCFMLQNSLETEGKRLKAEIVRIDADVKQTTQRLDEARNSYDDYQKISSDKLSRSGTEILDIPYRIREAKKPLEALKERYRLIGVDMSLTPPAEQSGILKKENVTAVNSRVTLRFSSVTDELAYSFIDSLADEFPGYVRPISLVFTKASEINDPLIAQVRTGNLPAVINCIIVFDWYELKVNQTAAPASSIPAAPAAKPAG